MRKAFTIFLSCISIYGFSQNDSLSLRLNRNKATIDSLKKVVNSLELKDDSLLKVILNEGSDPELSISDSYEYNKLLSDYKVFRKRYRKLIKSNILPDILPSNNIHNQSIIGFGEKIHPVYKNLTRHEGIDIPEEKGSDIISTIDGIVVSTKNSFGRQGNQLVIQNTDSIKIIFLHMGDIVVKKGETIKRGQTVGHIGSSGLSIRDHLHYEIQINDVKIDPIFSVFNKFSKQDLDYIYRINILSLD